MKICFICHANICRSLMAQELLKKELLPLCPTAGVYSRGLYADTSYQVPEKVRLFLTKNGIGGFAHQSTQLSALDLAQADLVLFMQQAQLDFVLDRYAQYTDKFFLLQDYAFGKAEDLPDPISLSGRAFEKNAQKLLQAVHAVAVKISHKI